VIEGRSAAQMYAAWQTTKRRVSLWSGSRRAPDTRSLGKPDKDQLSFPRDSRRNTHRRVPRSSSKWDRVQPPGM